MTSLAAHQSLVRQAAPLLVRQPAQLGLSAAVADALTARGFFCASHNGGLLVFDDRDAADVAVLLGLAPMRLAPSVSAFDFPSTLASDPGDLVERILGVPSPEGTTSIGVRWTTWSSYRGCRFGARLQPSSLDGGVALLVRVFNMVGCPTSYSGHGIGDRFRFVIEFDGEHSAAWAGFLLELLSDSSSGIRFRGVELQIGRPTRDPRRAAEDWVTAVRLAQAIRARLDLPKLRRLRSMTIDSFNERSEAAAEPTGAAFVRRARDLVARGDSHTINSAI